MSTIILSKYPVSAAVWMASSHWAWSRWTFIGTEAARADVAAAVARTEEEYCCAQGKRRIIAGDFFASPARTLAKVPLILC